MPVDANIFSQYLKAPKSVLEYDADADVAQGRKNALQLAAMDLSEKTQANQRAQSVRSSLMGLGASATDEARINALRATATPEGFAQADTLEKALLERKKTGAQVTKDAAQTKLYDSQAVDARLKQSRQFLDIVTTPEQYMQWHRANHADPVLGPLLAERGVTAEQSVASINEAVRTGKFQELLDKSKLGVEKFAEMAQTKALADERNATTRRGQDVTAQTAALGRKQADAHFQAGQSTPEYKETDAGLMALPKKLAPGQAPTGTLVTTPDGQPLGKPLKPIPQGVNTAIIANSQATNQIDRALSLLDGQDVGSMKGDKNATGWKAYAPNGVLNRLDPKGVDARAEISDIGSMKIHDRSGAAVTLSEAPRLMPFIPLATDDAATVKKKLTRLKMELANESTALQDTYGKDQGYRPSPVKPAGAGGGLALPTDIAAILQQHGGK